MTKRKTKEMRYEDRQWLNKGTSQGRATASASYSHGDLNVSWILGDCNRQVHLDFATYGCLYSPTEKSKKVFNRSVEERLKKIGVLIEQLEAMEAFIIEAQEKFNTVDFPKAVQEEAERKLKEDAEGWVDDRKPRLARPLGIPEGDF